jgi:hypothetical protein
VVLPTATLKYRLLRQTTIFNAEIFTILKATEHSKHMHRKTVIMTDSLSSLTALKREYPGRNPTIPKILSMLVEEAEDLKLMWVPENTEIENNESTKKSLHEERAQEIRAIEND